MQEAHWRSSTSGRKIGDLITADHKVLNEEGDSRNNHRYAVVVLDIATQWIHSYPCKQQLPMRRRGVYESFSSCRKSQKSWILTIHWNLANLVKIYHGIIVPHRSETNGIADRAVRRVKEGTSAVLLQSGLYEKVVG